MRVALLFILCMVVGVGCSPESLSYNDVTRLPHKWEVQTIYIRLPYEMGPYDPNIEIVKVICREFAIRLYDAFDGQAFAPEFVICNPSVILERKPGVINFFEKCRNTDLITETFMGNPPDRPGRSYVEMPSSLLGVDAAAGAMLHEFLHSYVGLGDEYKHSSDEGNRRTTDCPKLPYSSTGISSNACVMDHDETRRELCLQKDHNPDTDQGKESCYEYVARVLFEHRLAFILVPKETIHGPTDAPTPIIEVRLK